MRMMYNEGSSLLLNHTKKLLENCIKRFPNCIDLKLHYAHFMLDYMGNKREAMKELSDCIKLKPYLD